MIVIIIIMNAVCAVDFQQTDETRHGESSMCVPDVVYYNTTSGGAVSYEPLSETSTSSDSLTLTVTVIIFVLLMLNLGLI